MTISSAIRMESAQLHLYKVAVETSASIPSLSFVPAACISVRELHIRSEVGGVDASGQRCDFQDQGRNFHDEYRLGQI